MLMSGSPVVAKWWELSQTGKIRCTLCPRFCEMGEGQHGFCYIRKNEDNRLISLGYGRPTGFAIDPIEKKPLSHFLPGSKILSFGTAGCNLGCKFCQNWTMSKARLDDLNAQLASPADVVALARRYKTPSIAFTYNDPVIFAEYAADITQLAVESGIHTVFVTAGYVTSTARDEVFRGASAANVDLKGFTERFYRQLTWSDLHSVLDTLVWMKEKTTIWIELTTLLIPGENDSTEELKEMTKWVVSNLGERVPVHFTAFHPDFKMKDRSHTPAATLHKARNIALDAGLNYVYTGNVHDPDGQTTYCPGCGSKVITRDWHSVLSMNMKGNQCGNCGTRIDGVFA